MQERPVLFGVTTQVLELPSAIAFGNEANVLEIFIQDG